MYTAVGAAWSRYYYPGMTSEEAQAFKAGYSEGVDAVANYIGCLHPETKLEDILLSIKDAIDTGII